MLVVAHTLVHCGNEWWTRVARKKRHAAGRKLIGLDEGILHARCGSKLVRRTTSEPANAFALGAVKLSGFGARVSSRRAASRYSSRGMSCRNTVLGSTDEKKEKRA